MRKQLAGVGVGLLLLAPACALAQSTSITDQIAALLQQIKTLQAQIATLQLGSQHSCVDLSDNLTLGASGAAVSNLQNYLITKGYLGAQYHTGYYGFLTVAAVGKLQLQQGLVSSQDDQAYGIAGSKTRAAISCTGTTPPPPTPVACPSGYHSNGETCVSNVGSFAASPTYGVAPLAVTFKISATDSTYTINFGDGTSAPSPQPSAICSGAVVCTDPGTNISHTYTATGTYKAQLVKDPCAGAVGCVAPTQLLSTITISVVAVGQPQPQPVAGFTATPTAGAAPLAVSFSSSQAGTVNFGDGQSSMLQSSLTACIGCTTTYSVSHTYIAAATYTAKLQDSSGTVFSSIMITVNNPTPTPQPTPEVSFSASPASGAAPLAVVFTASGISTANGVISMDYGDGSLVQTGYCLGGTCGSATYYHTYSAGGTYTAKLLQSSQTLATTVVTVTGSSQTAVSVHVSPSSVQQGSAPLSTGGTLHITWSSTNAPVGAGVAMWIVKSDGTTLGSIYPGTRATSGSYDWAVPGPQCDSTGLNCMYQTDSDSAYYTSPGTYYILAKLYTPSNACTGLCIIANPVQPTYIATAKSATFTITGNTVSVATPSVGPMSGYNTAQCVAPTAPACASGYHQCTGSGCSYIGEIVPAPYYCLTSENPVVIMNLPTGSSWPMNNCYNAPPQSSLGLVSSSVDYLGCSLAASCVPN